jgi:hypothetical protein
VAVAVAVEEVQDLLQTLLMEELHPLVAVAVAPTDNLLFGHDRLG